MSLLNYFRKEGNNGDLEKVNLFENGGIKRKTDTECAVAISPKRHKQQSVMAKMSNMTLLRDREIFSRIGLIVIPGLNILTRKERCFAATANNIQNWHR